MAIRVTAHTIFLKLNIRSRDATPEDKRHMDMPTSARRRNRRNVAAMSCHLSVIYIARGEIFLHIHRDIYHRGPRHGDMTFASVGRDMYGHHKPSRRTTEPRARPPIPAKRPRAARSTPTRQTMRPRRLASARWTPARDGRKDPGWDLHGPVNGTVNVICMALLPHWGCNPDST